MWCPEQARQRSAALSLGRGGDPCGAPGPGLETLLPAQTGAERAGGRQRSPWLANSGFGSGSCGATRSTTKSSAAADNCGSKVAPMRGCVVSTVVLQRSDRETDWATQIGRAHV